MARILLVRHGQSTWNAEGRWQGQADIELSDLGRAQARAAATRLGTFDLIAASTLLRAAETAFIISEALGIGPILPILDLVERNAGEWSGLTRADIERDWAGYLEQDRRPPDYELDVDFWSRIQRGLAEVASHLGDPFADALVVAHGGLIYHLEERTGQRRGRIENLGALWIDVGPDGDIEIGERVQLIDSHSLESAQSSELL